MSEPEPADTPDNDTPAVTDPVEGGSSPARPPGRPGLSRERFDEAWAALTERGAGREPTLRELRRYLGSGSLSTLTRYRRLRSREAQTRDEQAAPGSIDAALLATVASIVDTLAEEAAEAADARIADVRKQADARVKASELVAQKMQQDSALLTQRAHSAEADLSRCRDLLAASQAAHQSAQSEHLAIATRHASLTAEHEALRQQLANLEAQRLASEAREATREQTWQQERQEHVSALTEQKDHCAELNSRLAITEHTVHTLNASLTTANEALAEQQQHIANHAVDQHQWTSTRDELTRSIDSLQREKDALQAEHGQQLNIERERLAAECATVTQLREQMQTQQTILEQLQHMVAQLTAVQGDAVDTPGRR